eukprot:2612970-Lingulodinium_polyedra.AAC.1
MGHDGNGPRQDQQMHPAQGDNAQSDSRGSDNSIAVPGEGQRRQKRWPRRPQPSRRREMAPGGKLCERRAG